MLVRLCLLFLLVMSSLSAQAVSGRRIILQGTNGFACPGDATSAQIWFDSSLEALRACQDGVVGTLATTANVQLLSEKGDPDGYAPLDSESFVPDAHLDPDNILKKPTNSATFGDGTSASIPWTFNTSGSNDCVPTFTDGQFSINCQVRITSGGIVIDTTPGETFASFQGMLRERPFGLRANSVIETDQAFLFPVFMPQQLVAFGCKTLSAGDTLTFNLQRDDGTPADILTSNYTASNTWSTVCAVSQTEILNEGNFTTDALWTEAGDFAFSGGAAVYTHSGGTGSITQTEGNQQNPPADGARWYRIALTLSAVAGNPTLAVGTGLPGSPPISITMSNGAKSVRFFGSATPGSVVLQGTSDSGDDTFTMDNVSIVAAPCDQDLINTSEDNFLQGEGLGYNYVSDSGDPDGLSCVLLFAEE